MRTTAAVLVSSISLLVSAQSPAPQLPTAPSGKPLAFTIISVKPHGNNPGGTQGCNIDACHLVDVPLRLLVVGAYNIPDDLIVGGPSWQYDDRFDIDAKIDPADQPATPPSRLQLFTMLQPVLAQSFQLRVHHEMRPSPVYALVLAKGGSKLQPATQPPGGPCGIKSQGSGSVSTHNCWMEAIAHLLSNPVGRTVIDHTGLTGRYDFELHWTPDNTPADSPLAGGPSIFTAVQEQLGLKLEPSTAPLDVLVIDSIEKPSQN